MASRPVSYEIERKFLIERPSADWLASLSAIEIEQIYLRAEEGEERRIRSRTEKGVTTFVTTVKRTVSALRREETECEISEDEYLRLRKDADLCRRPLHKTRYCLPCGGHVAEIDVYPFLADCAILEIELSLEDESFSLPPQLRILREVTDDPAYKNAALAARIE